MDFGYHNASFAYDEEPLAEAMLERARFVEDAGFSWYALMDHLRQLPIIGRKTEPFVECYSGCRRSRPRPTRWS